MVQRFKFLICSYL